MARDRLPRRMLSLLPPAWRADIARCELEPIRRGMSGAAVFRLRDGGAGERYLKIAQGEDAGALRQEIERTAWLGAKGIRVPSVLETFDGGVIVAALTAALPGVPADESPLSPSDLVDAIAKALATLHAIPVDACRFDESVAVRLARARADIARGAIDASAFHPRNAGLTPKRLYDRLVANLPAREDLVVVHGDATFANILVAANGDVGFIDCGHAGRGDRCIDLALIAEEIEDRFGEEWIAPFMRRYGRAAWSPEKARFFSDLYELF